MKNVFKIAVIVALVTLCYEMVAQDAQPVNGQEFSPNGIEMIYVEGQGNIKSFYIGKYEVTHKVWTAVMGNPRSKDAIDDRPVDRTSWLDVQVFIKRLNELSGRTYRLPTEAEWEFAAKGGTLSKGYKFSGSNTLAEVANISTNYATPPAVGGKKPNELGIYDMTGNVFEMCGDLYDSKSDVRVMRGGGVNFDKKFFPVEARAGIYPGLVRVAVGFRLVLEP